VTCQNQVRLKTLKKLTGILFNGKELAILENLNLSKRSCYI